MVSIRVISAFLVILVTFVIPTFAVLRIDERTCCFGNDTYNYGDVILSLPEKCAQLICDVNGKNRLQYYDSPDDCHCCEFNGRMYKNGQKIGGICTDITCRAGRWTTRGYFDECCKKCSVVDDPHFTTYDGVMYDFHGKCNYSISQFQYGYDAKYGIYGGFEPCNHWASCLGHTTFKDNEHTVIQFDHSSVMDVLVNDQPYVTTTAIQQVITNVGHPVLAWKAGSCNMFVGSQGFLVRACRYTMTVWAYPNLLDQINGLCGHFNFYKPDDFTDRDEIQHPLTLNPLVFPVTWLTTEQSKEECKQVTDVPTGPETGPCIAPAPVLQGYKDDCKLLLESVTYKGKKPSAEAFEAAVYGCAIDCCIMIRNLAPESEILAWKQILIEILTKTTETEVKTTEGAKPPHHDDCKNPHSCNGKCGNCNRMSVQNKVQIMINPGQSYLQP